MQQTSKETVYCENPDGSISVIDIEDKVTTTRVGGRLIHTETIRATVDPDYPIYDSESDLGG